MEDVRIIQGLQATTLGWLKNSGFGKRTLDRGPHDPDSR